MIVVESYSRYRTRNKMSDGFCIWRPYIIGLQKHDIRAGPSFRDYQHILQEKKMTIGKRFDEKIMSIGDDLIVVYLSWNVSDIR